MEQPTRKLLAAFIITILSGCSTLGGSDFADKSQEALNSIKEWRQVQSKATGATHLTDLLSSEEVQRLIQLGLQKNPEIQQTALAIQIAREQVSAAKSDRRPHASLNLTQRKTESSDSQYQSSLQLSWTIDWLQQLQDNVDASEANLVQYMAADQYARDILASAIMDTWLQLVQQNQLIKIEQNRLKVFEQSENTIVERYRKGLGELSALDFARSQSASSRAILSAYRESYNSLQRSMASLLGETEFISTDDTVFPDVITPLVSIPAQDLGRRPDLQQAFINIRIADLNSSITYKSLLPSLSLSASLSQTDTVLRHALFTSQAWSLLNQLTTPLFQGGKLRAQARIANLTAEQSYWAYQELLLKAVKEVEDAIGQESALSEQQAHIEVALGNAQLSFETYQTKYRQGLVRFLDLLTVQAQTFDLQVRKTQITYNLLSNRITLGLALGLGVKS